MQRQTNMWFSNSTLNFKIQKIFKSFHFENIYKKKKINKIKYSSSVLISRSILNKISNSEKIYLTNKK